MNKAKLTKYRSIIIEREYSLESLIKKLEEALKQIPLESRKFATVEYNIEYESFRELEICYPHKETDEEQQERIKREKKVMSEYRKSRLEEDKREYERLKKKFEKKIK